MNNTEEKMTFKVYHYTDADGRDVFKAKYYWAFGIWCFVYDKTDYDQTDMRWATRDEMMDHLLEMAEARRLDLRNQKKWERAAKLTLVTIEEVQL